MEKWRSVFELTAINDFGPLILRVELLLHHH